MLTVDFRSRQTLSYLYSSALQIYLRLWSTHTHLTLQVFQ